jgi:hypothetical protein
VGSAHYDLYAGGAKGVGCPVCPGDHAGHRANSYQVDLLVFDELDKLGIAHWFRVTIEEQNLVAWRGAGLKKEHP